MEQWYTGQELIERWEITAFELLEFIRKKGLQPYTASGRAVSDSTFRLEMAKYGSKHLAGRTTPEALSDRPFSHIVEIDGYKIPKRDNEVLRPFTLPGDENVAEKLLDEIRQFRFKAKDVDGIEKKIGTSRKPPIGREVSCKSNWSRGYDIFQQHDLFPADLRDAIKEGKLSAYDRRGRKVLYWEPPKRWRLPMNPVTKTGIYMQLTDREIYSGIFFKDDDVIAFLERNNPNDTDSVKTHPEPQHDTAPAPAVPPVPVKTSAVNFFTREGAIWHIGFEDKETRINHLDGLLYISFLLEKPGTPISCRKLYQAASGKTPVNVMSEGAAIGQELNIGGSKQAIGTREASKICRENYQELDLKLLDAGIEEREEIQEKMAALIPYMNLKERNIPDPNDAKAQANMRKRLDTAYKAIGKKKGMKEMEKHLRDHIKPDGAFGLSYTGTFAWEITL